MNKYLAGYAGVALALLALDMLWLGVVAKQAYQQGIGHLMAEEPRLLAAAAFYLVYPLGLMVFVLATRADWGPTLMKGALFGLFAYATYDLSNLATLKGWPLGLALMDIAWGTALSATAVAAGKAAMDWVGWR